MQLDLGDLRLRVLDHGAPGAPAIVFAHALGLDLTVWDGVLPHLPAGLRLVRYDLRGHGGSDVPEPPYPMAELVADAANLITDLDLAPCAFVGLSIGGVIAQGLGAERPDLVRGLVLSNTAAKIGTPDMWRERADFVGDRGLGAIVEPTLERWFPPRFRSDAPEVVDHWRRVLGASDPAGYRGCALGLGEADLRLSTPNLAPPVLAIAGEGDGSTPPDNVRDLADSVPGAEFHLLPGAGHLPPVTRPEAMARAITAFLRRIGHMPT